MRRKQFLLICSLAGLLEVRAAVEYTFTYENINTAIPELNPSGLTDVRTVSAGPGLTIVDVDVSLTISGTGFGGFNGDLFVTLEHETGYAVLLNRPGSRDGFRRVIATEPDSMSPLMTPLQRMSIPIG